MVDVVVVVIVTSSIYFIGVNGIMYMATKITATATVANLPHWNIVAHQTAGNLRQLKSFSMAMRITNNVRSNTYHMGTCH